MKKILFIFILTTFTFEVFSQNLEKSVKKFWWNIEESCFTGVSLTKKNGMFMSTAQKIPVGATYIIHRNLFGRIRRASLDLTHKSIKEKLSSFPDMVDSASSTPPCSFELKKTMDYQVDIAAKLADESNIGKINVEMQQMLKQAIATNLTITSWGFEILEQGKVELCLAENSNDSFVKFLRNGERYIVLTAVWIKGIRLDYSLDEQTLTKIKAIYETNKQAFINAGVTFDFKSTTNFFTSFNYDNKFYPFYRFGKITKKGKIKALTEVYIEEPDFSDFNK